MLTADVEQIQNLEELSAQQDPHGNASLFPGGYSVSIQESAYDLFGDMLLEKEVKEICKEIESEKRTKAEADMKDFFIAEVKRLLPYSNDGKTKWK